jgi:maltooligosyltrehalose trehalohydrolase
VTTAAPDRRAAAQGHWTLERGATLVDGGARFAVWAPHAEHVTVRLVSGGAAGDHPLERRADGTFDGIVHGVVAGDDYYYVLADRARVLPDPVSRWQPSGVHGPSRVVDPHDFEWTDGDWRGLAMADLVIYELHVGTFSDDGTFAGVAAHLQHLVELGVTAIELMPVAEFPGARNWGYDGVYLYAPQSSYGGPDGLRRLVNAAHEAGLAVVLDIVYNHLGPEGNYLGEFGPYFTSTYCTPWGQAVNYDGPLSDDVRRFVVDNARYWVSEFHIDALRLDAVHGIFDFGARHILQELAQAVHATAAELGRSAQVIAESDLNDPRLVRPLERGGYSLDAQWTDDFHHSVHVALTGERTGYYQDFGGVASLATQLERRFVYEGAYSPFRRRRHGASAVDVSADRFVISIQNHDQVGNRATGDRLAALVDFDRLKLAAACMLLSPYVPMLFMGEEYGETNPFLYFTSHGDPDLVQAVREGRRREFESFAWDVEVPDPQAEESLARSRLDWSRAADPGNAALLALYRDLIALRRSEPALRPGSAHVRVESAAAAGWVGLVLAPSAGGSDVLLALFNFGDGERAVPVDGGPRAWRIVLSTDAPRYAAGSGERQATMHAPLDVEGSDRHVLMAARSAALFRRGSD